MKIEVEADELCYKCLERYLKGKGVERSFNTRTEMIEYIKKEQKERDVA